jgi:hypothetical protein
LLGKLTSVLRDEVAFEIKEEAFSYSFLVGLSHLSAPAADREHLFSHHLTNFLRNFPELGESMRLPLVLLSFYGPSDLTTVLWPVLNLARAY